MIGNDIVDLHLAKTQSNWLRKGWLEKLFTEDEQYHILNTADSELEVWKLWSKKEAAYKAHQRRFSLAPRFNPRWYQCQGETVGINGYIYHTNTSVSRGAVYSIATTDQQAYFTQIVNQGVSVKEELKNYISQICSVTSNDIILIKKDNGIPYVKIKDQLDDIPFSLTHHGNFSAFIIALRK
ncbi:4'-phosphopantetheinyl transferase family protein [Aquimarina spongiae]|uniref:4'-phosphopantetheinyl transferase superfamily protein n=1 Tax=Aquimarina spongiae TaxID=570521 RepID=A0A1M6B8F4_9FLAO|nr:4'-phosphopantetheinyl transferase superfamily protein [Aquimarina spongiae]SHI45014.1 4'-phosphopantetheinyl transferase superfamily protein [Aquimarina spongiae]